MDRCQQRFLRPEPRVRLGTLIGRTRAASSCVDLSDGLADGVRQLTMASGVGAIIETSAVPIDPEARRCFEEDGRDPITAALEVGEDYELLFTVPRNQRNQYRSIRRLMGSLQLTRIGVITRDKSILLHSSTGYTSLPAGFDHFK